MRLLFLHGLPGTGRQWADVAAAFPAFQVLTPTFDGFENAGPQASFPSTEEHARNIVEWCAGSEDDTILVAWSFACHPLLFAMARFGFAPARAILIEPSGDSYLKPVDREAFERDAAAAFEKLFLFHETADDETLARLSFEATGSETAWTTLPATRRSPFVRSAAALRRAFRSAATPSRIDADELARIGTPIDILVGSDTRTMFSIAARALAQTLPNAHLHVVAGADHLWPVTAQNELAAFLQHLIEEDA